MNKIIFEIVGIFIAVLFFGILIAFVLNSFSEQNLCKGVEPIEGEGILIGSKTYSGLAEKKWNYSIGLDEESIIGIECVWTCKEGYKKLENECVEII